MRYAMIGAAPSSTDDSMPFRRCCRAGILTAAAAVFVLCTTRSALRFEKLSQRTLDNEFLPAIASIKKHPNLYGKNNRFLYHMDIGALHHYAGDFDSSTTYLLKAADIFDELFARSVTNEAAAIMTNDNIRPYRSKPYELVMLHFFLSCNYLAGGNVDDALVETRRVQLFFDEWNRKNRSDLKYDSDAMFHYLSSISYDAAGETSDAMISLFHSIKAFQEGPVSLPAPLRDWAYFMFRINDRESDNRLLQLKPELPREKIAGLMNDATEIIFIGYAGRGPVIEEQSWWGTWI
ncbi:MAG: hypothetical protein JXA18_07935, partial [Chitinispirillaceae bacterium]|nr:hypothetical protein [Chitinispirillaceae bacterium]